MIMPKIDLDRIQALVASKTGLADPDAVSKIQPGAVFEISDDLVRFPGDPPRTWHDFRRVIVVQAHHLLGPVEPSSVSVVPCSASRQTEGRGNLLVPAGETAFTKPSVVALCTLLMPVPKTALSSDGYRGSLSPETYGRLLAVIAINLGIASNTLLPPRQSP